MPNPARLLLAAAALATACQQSTTAPRLVLTETPGDVDQVKLAWSRPDQGDFSAFVIEARQVPGAFQAVASAPPSQTTLVYRFPSSVSEATDHEFRVRALPEPDGDRASPPRPFHRGVRPPVVTGGAGADQITIGLRNQSASADRLIVTRRFRACGAGSPVEAAPVVLPAATTSWTDPASADWWDGDELDYRVVAALGEERSVERVVGPGPAPLLAPVITAVGPAPQGAQVTFTGASRCASSVVARLKLRAGDGRDGPQAVVPSPAPGGQGVVTVAAQPGLFVAAACAVNGLGPSRCATTTDPVAVAPPGLTAAPVAAPTGRLVARVGAGGFASAGAGAAPSQGPNIRAPGPAGEDVLVRPGSLLVSGAPVVDPGGQVHVILEEERTYPSDPVELLHAWHDGSTWQVEPFASAFSSNQVALAAGPDGTLHVAWRDRSATRGPLQVARRRGGAWERLASPPLPANLPSPYQVSYVLVALAGDEAGEPALLISKFTYVPSAEVARHGPDGWVVEQLPALQAATQQPLALCVPTAGPRVVLLDAPARRLSLLRREASGWVGPTLAAAYQPSGPTGEFTTTDVACAPDQERQLIALRYGRHPADRYLWLLGPDGTTTSSWFTVGTVATPLESNFAAGFGVDGRAWVLENTSDAPPAFDLPAVLFEER